MTDDGSRITDDVVQPYRLSHHRVRISIEPAPGAAAGVGVQRQALEAHRVPARLLDPWRNFVAVNAVELQQHAAGEQHVYRLDVLLVHDPREAQPVLTPVEIAVDGDPLWMFSGRFVE